MRNGRNIGANFVARAWTGVLNFACVPIYVRYLGIEAYGLIGFFTTLMALSLIFDMGVGTTINRELARLQAGSASVASQRNLVRTLECLYWAMAAILGLSLIVLAPWIARSWLSAATLSLPVTTHAVQLMGGMMFLRWPMALYLAALMGLHRQVVANAVAVAMTTLQTLGAAIVVSRISPTVGAFFSWQILAALLQAMIVPLILWRCMPNTREPLRFSVVSLRSVWRFAAGMSGITILSAILNQADKFLLSRLLPLEQYGFYSLANSVAATLTLVSMSVYAAMFPVLSALAAEGRRQDLSLQYHRAAQLLSVILLPPAMLLIFFPRELLQLYVHSVNTANQTYVLLGLLAAGNLVLSLLLLPFALQLAYGWTTLSLYKSIIALPILVPLMIFMINRFGAIGAACTWVALPFAYFCIEIPLMHRKLLSGEAAAWYLKDVGVASLVSFVCVGAARIAVADNSTPALTVSIIAAAAAVVAGLISLVLMIKFGGLSVRKSAHRILP